MDQSGFAPPLTFAQIDNYGDDPTAIGKTDKAALMVYSRALSESELAQLRVYVSSHFELYTSDGVNMTTKPSTATGDWLPDAMSWVTQGARFSGDVVQNPFRTAVAAFHDAGVKVIYLDLGANDYIQGTSLSQFTANFATIVDSLLAEGFSLIVDLPYRTASISTAYTDLYRDAIESICSARDLGRIVVCTRMGYDWGNAHIADSAFTTDGVHFNAAGGEREKIQKQFEIARALPKLVSNAARFYPGGR